MNDLLAHPAAELFPLMEAKRYAELAADIAEYGLREPIVTFEGKILDGRNRYRACGETGIEPRFIEAIGDPYAFVWSLNGQRRDLLDDQRSLIWLYVNEASAEWRAAQEAIREEGDRKRSEAMVGKRNAAKDKPEIVVPQLVAPPIQPERSSAVAAKAAGTNRGSVERMSKLKRRRPDLADKVRDGGMKPTAALRRMKKDEVKAKVAALPDEIFRVLYVDPPWQYSDERAGLGAGEGQKDRASTAAGDHYPTMPKADICALNVKSLAAPDAVLFCWATFPLLPDALEVVQAWGFKYKTAFVWDKGRGTFGHYHTAEAELLLVCTRGSCTPDIDAKEKQVQRWPRGAHSRKPLEAVAMIDRLYPHGPRIELFCRGEPPAGWVGWGAELAAAGEAA
jgi:N6-adenosine-specific RNA methylase IME4